MALLPIYECHDEGELSIIKSLLEANAIPFFVQNEHFGSLYPGSIMSFNTRLIMIDEVNIDRASILLSRIAEDDPVWDRAS